MKRVGSWLTAGVLLSGCAMFAPRDEYLAYRAYRYETSADQRTALGAEYLARYPHGQFASRVTGEVGGREDAFWEERRGTQDGLQAYLTAYPNGTHATEARARLGVYEGERQRLLSERRAREAAENARQQEELRAQGERQRFFARTTIRDWLRTLGGLDGWGNPIPVVAQHNAEFNAGFGGEPAPVCRQGRCRKTWHVDFFVPVPGRSAQPRRLEMALDLLRLPSLTQAQLVMRHRGLTTWFEEEQEHVAPQGDADARSRSVQWSVDQLKGIVALAFPDARETPPELVGPEPEMEGEVSDEGETAAPAGGDAQPAAGAAGAAPAAAAIPPQPLGVQFSYVVGCGSHGGRPIAAPPNSRPEGWDPGTLPAVNAHSCLRIDVYSAPDIEGVSTDEGLRISFIAPAALGAPAAAPAHPGHPAHPARPAHPAAPAHPAHPAAAH